MVFSVLHWLPSAIAAILTVLMAFGFKRQLHKYIGIAAISSAFIGLVGYLSQGNVRLYPLDFHTIHSWIGLSAFLLSIYIFIDRIVQRRSSRHCRLGYAAASLSVIALLMGLAMLSGIASLESSPPNTSISMPNAALQVPASSKLPEFEAKEFQGIALEPLRLQGNNAIQGTQIVDREAYRLKVIGLVDKEISWTYDDLLGLQAYSEVAYMPCVEGWGFNAKWTGFQAMDLLNRSGVRPEAKYIIFRTAENYSTGFPLDYLKEKNVLMAYGINDLTLPPDRGFPLQLVAKGKYGYKWAKWITSIEVTDKEERGYWESRGYSDSANVGEFPFG